MANQTNTTEPPSGSSKNASTVRGGADCTQSITALLFYPLSLREKEKLASMYKICRKTSQVMMRLWDLIKMVASSREFLRDDEAKKKEMLWSSGLEITANKHMKMK